MEIGISTAIFYPELLTEDAVKKLAEKGFSVMEVFANSFFEFREEYGYELKELAEKEKVKINSVHTVSSAFEPYLFDAYERRREDFFRIYQEFVRFGEILGAKAYTFHGLIRRPHRNMTFTDVVYMYERMVYEAGVHGMALAQENVSWCLSGDLEYLKRLKDAVKEPLKFTLDVKQAVKAGRSPYDYLDIYGEDLMNLHLNDHDRESTCLLPGKGAFDFQTLFRRVEALGYKGPGIIEVYKENYETLEELSESRKYLERIIP
ncbi:sugar phosphate isomerase/epimerase [Proteiniclasticum sp. SCR006]|uniref:Sugar phosphate isomerase/epimerase n=1 Tax=Proteiniclasticum aestuarii TaxID=2817862 RepID=A0A939HA68_9CLOT|nr:sugar phosphate isomerase/epimerase [Proteiniclasticum aestuarii]MBO1264232.1 sugar phosphate isomerase/epimerase [Proteiniclasticum aestuarii]